MVLYLTDILAQGGYEVALHYQIRGIYGVDAWESVLQWYHPTDPYPLEATVQGWEAACQAAETAIDNDDAALESVATTLETVFTFEQFTLFLELMAAVFPPFMAVGTPPTIAEVYETFVTELNGTSVEDALKDWVTAETGISTFGLGQTDANKRIIIGSALRFIYGGMMQTLVVRLKKYLKRNT